MGQRARHETIIAIIGAFVRNRRWTQADLGRAVGVSTPAVRKHLVEMKSSGWPLTEDKQVGNVVWRMPPQWHPGVLAFDTSEVPDLLRAVARSPRDTRQRRLLETIRKRLPLTTVAPTFEAAIRSPEISDAEQRWLDALEDGAARKIALEMHYFTASRRDADDRWVSVHHVETGPTALRRYVSSHEHAQVVQRRRHLQREAREGRPLPRRREARRGAVRQRDRRRIPRRRAAGEVRVRRPPTRRGLGEAKPTRDDEGCHH